MSILTFTGDLMIGGEYEFKVKERNLNNVFAFKILTDIFNISDIIIPNFEQPITNSPNRRKDKSSLFNCSNYILDNLKALNFNYFNLCNNHIHDYGVPGIEDTITELKNSKIEFFGIHNEERGIKPWTTFDLNGTKVGLLAFTSDEPWVNAKIYNEEFICPAYTSENIIDHIKEIKSQQVDLIIINMHWGFEQHYYPFPKQRDLARFCIDSGADLIIGHHPHVIQGYEVYKEKFIFYSLGHLFFSDFRFKDGSLKKWRKRNKYGLMLKLSVENKIIYDRNIIPIFQNDNYQIEILENEHKIKFNNFFNKLNSKFDYDDLKYKAFWLNHHLKQSLRHNFLRLGATIKNERNPIKIGKRFIKIIFFMLKDLYYWFKRIEPDKYHNKNY